MTPSSREAGRHAGAADGVSDERPAPAPAAAQTLFGERLDVAEHFAAILGTTGVEHGLIGPREIPRLWDRHLLNCAVVAPLIEEGRSVVDVGSGAGLPGLVLAIARPDLDLHLVEPLLRRTVWLERTIEELGLDNVDVRRGKAEAFHGSLRAPYVTARAVARLDPLARWCLPLLEEGGTMLALKGASASQELSEDAATLDRLGVVRREVIELGADLLEQPTRVIALGIERPVEADAGRQERPRRRREGGRGGRRRRSRG